MDVAFVVVLTDVEEDADISVLQECVEIALAKELPFIDATVEKLEA